MWMTFWHASRDKDEERASCSKRDMTGEVPDKNGMADKIAGKKCRAARRTCKVARLFARKFKQL